MFIYFLPIFFSHGKIVEIDISLKLTMALKMFVAIGT